LRASFLAGITTLTLGPIARSAAITRYPGAADGVSVPSATGIAVRLATIGHSSIRINGDIALLPGAEPAQVDQAIAVIHLAACSAQTAAWYAAAARASSNLRRQALGSCGRDRLGPHQRPGPCTLTSTNYPGDQGRNLAPVESIKIHYAAPRATHRPPIDHRE
jgi:hypothetical protein